MREQIRYYNELKGQLRNKVFIGNVRIRFGD